MTATPPRTARDLRLSSRGFSLSPILRASLRRLSISLAVLLAIAYLTFFGLIVGERGKAGLPTQPFDSGVDALRRTAGYLVQHPDVYRWHREEVPAPRLVLTLFARSAGLLALSLAIAVGVGVPLGIAITLYRGGRFAGIALPLSVLGISIPTFLLAMLMWILNVRLARWLGLEKAPLPPTGFGWDAHMLMPALVLAMRPLAQLMQVTHVSLSGVLGADYIRTARAKGLDRRTVINRHALRNILIPILTTVTVSLRFSLAALPVVELFFVWPGLGLALLQAIELGMSSLVVDLLLALGLLFLLVNSVLDLAYQFIDPRVRDQAQGEVVGEEQPTWRERWEGIRASLASGAQGIPRLWYRLAIWLADPFGRRAAASRLTAAVAAPSAPTQATVYPEASLVPSQPQKGPLAPSRLWILDSIGHNPALVIGTLLVVGFAVLAISGERWAAANPYETHGVMMIEGEIGAPPYVPSATFPWGSDAVGRDIQALVLAGAKTTLTLALLVMLARVFAGTVLGLQAGWWRNSWFDRLLNGVIAVWAAFPVTLFAMILILALGIQQGMGVFVLALCVVGWGEITQFVRAQVIGLKPQPYIEGARMVGARSGWLLTRHILPHLWAPLLVLAALEMASVLMLLADLGFLNVFLGGGFKAEIGEAGRMQPMIYHFSDVPEWGALLANIRNWWRSYPWLAWYPGAAFFLAILAFNLWGHGLRRFLDDNRVNIGRVINRYTVTAGVILLMGAGWLVRSTTPVSVYSEQAGQFDAQRAMKHIEALSSPAFQGRESGTPGARAAADYIAAQMEEIGLLPAGEKETFMYAMVAPRVHLAGMPRLEILKSQGDDSGERGEPLIYRRDFVEYTGYAIVGGEGEGAIAGLAVGPEPDGVSPPTGKGATAPKGTGSSTGYSQSLSELDLEGKVILLRQADYDRLSDILAETGSAERLLRRLRGILVATDPPARSVQPGRAEEGLGSEPGIMQRKNVFPSVAFSYLRGVPAMLITPATADRLLAGTGSLAGLEALGKNLEPGKVALTGQGPEVRLVLPLAPEDLKESYNHVIGILPGTGSEMGKRERGDTFEGAIKGLDSNVIIISAYYDGLGTGPDGTLYPSANDNASGVAAMLEIARVLVNSSAPPRKTVMFVAWSGGERGEGFSVANAMSAKKGLNLLTVESVIELSGLGAGAGKGLALGPGTSFSMVQLFQDAASRVGVPVTTRGRGPHFGQEVATGFGGRSALSAYVSWDGSDQAAHTAADSYDAIDEEKLHQAGQTTLLVASVLGQGAAQESPLGPLAPPTYYVEEARLFDEKRALEDITYLASDELEGRRPGTPGGRAAGDYIAQRFEEYGLEPIGRGGANGGLASYFQSFTVPYTTVVTAPVLSVTYPGGADAFSRTYKDHFDYWPRITDYMGSGDVEGQAVWLDDCRAGRVAGQDVRGKIVLCRQSGLTDYRQLTAEAVEGGAGGLMLVIEGRGEPMPRSSYASTMTLPFPAFYVFEPVAEEMLAGTGHTLAALERSPATVPLSTTVHAVMGVGAQQVEARNVLGLLPGSDPDHKDEIVILGAHYDGVGRDPDGTLYNGAYENASGVAAMLEILRLWHEQGYRPARSVLFAAWDDSDQGWFGAKHYVQHPAYPLDRTVAKLSLDMIGRGKDLYVVGRGAMADGLATSAGIYSATVEFIPQVQWGDSLPFYEAAVPTAMLWGVEDEREPSLYHRPEDDVENIRLETLRAAGVLAAHELAVWSGGKPTRPVPDTSPRRTARDLVLPTPICPTPWPMGAMTCDHGKWAH